MSNPIEDAIHAIVDVLAGRKNLGAAGADEIHEAITPGYTDKPVTAEEEAAAQAVLDRKAREQAKAEAAASADPDE